LLLIFLMHQQLNSKWKALQNFFFLNKNSLTWHSIFKASFKLFSFLKLSFFSFKQSSSLMSQILMLKKSIFYSLKFLIKLWSFLMLKSHFSRTSFTCFSRMSLLSSLSFSQNLKSFHLSQLSMITWRNNTWTQWWFLISIKQSSWTSWLHCFILSQIT